MIPNLPSNERRLVLLTALGICWAVFIRSLLFDFESGDYHVCLKGWYDHFLQEGKWRGLAHLDVKTFNYPPLYMTLLSLCTWLPLPKLYDIKLLSVVFDFIAAGLIGQIVFHLGGSLRKALLVRQRSRELTRRCSPEVTQQAEARRDFLSEEEA